jgi:long-chain acyl-CoA synthetase
MKADTGNLPKFDPFQFCQWIEQQVSSAESHIAPLGLGSYDGIFELSDLGAYQTVLVALHGVDLLQAVAIALRRNIRPILASPSLPLSRLHELALTIGARAVLVNTLSQSRDRGPKLIRTEGLGPTSPAGANELVLLTSGTSGINSACLFSIERLLLNASMHAESIGLRSTDRMLTVLPLTFSFTFVAQILSAFLQKMSLVVASPPFAPRIFCENILKNSISVTSLTPFYVKELLTSSHELPRNLRVLTVGGDNLPRPLVESLLSQRLGNELYLTYGLTQAGPRVTTLSAHVEKGHRLASVGRPLQGIEAWLEQIQKDGTGSLAVRTPCAANAQIGRIDNQMNELEAANRVVQTGDIFQIDDSGYLYFIHRISDVIIQAGEKVSLGSIRARAEQIPAVVKVTTRMIQPAGPVGRRYVLILYTHVADRLFLEQNTRDFLRNLRPAERPADVEWHSADSVLTAK